jgi:hypothetical protein
MPIWGFAASPLAAFDAAQVGAATLTGERRRRVRLPATAVTAVATQVALSIVCQPRSLGIGWRRQRRAPVSPCRRSKE